MNHPKREQLLECITETLKNWLNVMRHRGGGSCSQQEWTDFCVMADRIQGWPFEDLKFYWKYLKSLDIKDTIIKEQSDFAGKKRLAAAVERARALRKNTSQTKTVTKNKTTASKTNADHKNKKPIIIIASDLPDKIRKRFNIKSQSEFGLIGIDWTDYKDTPDIESPESLSPFHTVFRGRQNLLWCADKGGKGTLMTTEIKWLLENTDYRVLVFNSDEPRSDFGSRNDRAGVPYESRRFRIVDDVGSWGQMACEIEAFRPNVIYFDALTSILDKLSDDCVPDNGDDNGWARIMNNFETMVTGFETVEHKIGSCIIHHATKQSFDRDGNKSGGRQYRGSAIIASRCTTRIELKTNRNNLSSELHFTGRHYRQPIYLKYDPDKFIYKPIDEFNENQDDYGDTGYTKTEIEIIKMLISGEPISRSELLNITSNVNLTRFKKTYNIKTYGHYRPEKWKATPSQIKEWSLQVIDPDR